ncbi:MAG: polysaccharide deacetylase, partial [Bacteriovoracia bacterium]
YAEGKNKRRMMSVSLHDRIGGTPAIVEVMDQFIKYGNTKKNVQFMRKDDIAMLVLEENRKN